MSKNTWVTLYAFQEMNKHLKKVKRTETRKRERIRAGIALRRIGKWLKEGKKIYEQEQRSSKASI